MASAPTMEAVEPGYGEESGSAQAAAPAAPRPDPKREFEKWHQRFDGSRLVRERWKTDVWDVCYDGLLGSLVRDGSDDDVTNVFAQFADIVMPHLRGDNREVTVRVNRIAAEQNAEAKMQLAAILGDQATALGRSLGLYTDNFGRPGELVKAYWNYLWGMGVILLGFNAPAGKKTVTVGEGEDAEQREVDLDLASAERLEQNDAGMPWARSVRPDECLFDLTYNDVAKGRWAAVECYHALAECKARWPRFADKWARTHKSVPGGDGGEDRERGDEFGVVRIFYAYTREPQQLVLVPDQTSGVDEVLETLPIELGFEGLPFLCLGARWPAREPYPKPPLAELIGPGRAENEFLQTIRAAGGKIKSGIVTSDEKLAEQIRSGDDNGVYVAPSAGGQPIAQVCQTFDIGALRAEHTQISAMMHENVERQGATSDFALGRREPGNPTAREISTRQSAIGARMQGTLGPVRTFEALVYQRLMAIAYAKIDLLHGMLMPLQDSGPQMKFAVFDANQPMIGEMLDYAFEVQVSDEITDADQVQSILQMADFLGKLAQPLQMVGKTVRWDILASEAARKSGLPRAAELIVDLPPPPPQMAPPGQAAAGQPQPGGPPPQAPEQQTDPRQLLAQLYAALKGMKEGDPRENQVLTMIAQIQAGAQQQVAA